MSSDVPREIYGEILSRLPTKLVLQCRVVCKEWRRLIDHPSFLKAHTKKHLSSHNLLFTTGNGILYSSPLGSLNPGDRPLNLPVNLSTIWNPLTQEIHYLTRPKPVRALVSRGFGYDSAGDYKVVTIESVEHEQGYRYISRVYSMKSGCWRRISDCPYLDNDISLEEGDGDIIIVLDLNSEAYGNLELPPPGSGMGFIERCYSNLTALDGFLVFSYWAFTTNSFYGWLLMDDRKSWKQLFSVGLFNLVLWERAVFVTQLVTPVPVAYVKDRKQLLLQRGQDFFLLNLANNHVSEVSFQGIVNKRYMSTVYSWQISQDSFFSF